MERQPQEDTPVDEAPSPLEEVQPLVAVAVAVEPSSRSAQSPLAHAVEPSSRSAVDPPLVAAGLGGQGAPYSSTLADQPLSAMMKVLVSSASIS